MENLKHISLAKLKVLLFILLLIIFGFFLVGLTGLNYSQAKENLQNGEVERAWIWLETISYRPKVKYTLPMVRGIVFSDVDATVKAIKSDNRCAKCLYEHTLDEWKGYVNNYIDALPQNQKRDDIIEYRDSVLKKFGQ